jgi:hypothetical protein
LTFAGSVPALELWKPVDQARDEFRRAWVVRILPVGNHYPEAASIAIRLSDPDLEISQVEESPWYRVELQQPKLLGSRPYGEFEVRAQGPIGQDQSFRIVLRPSVQITHDWTEWSERDTVRISVQVPRISVLQAQGVTQDGPGSYTLLSVGRPVDAKLEIDGYGPARWALPLRLDVPVPAWALYEPSAGSHLVEWTRLPLRLSLAEIDGHEPELLARLTTPWGIPRVATLHLLGPRGPLASQPVLVGEDGFGSAPLLPLLATARQRNLVRFDLQLELELKRTVNLRCGTLTRRWSPADLQVEIVDGRLEVAWSESQAVQGRAVRVVSLLAPWLPAATIPVADGDRGRWSLPAQEAPTSHGRYRIDLGVADEWSGRFDPAASALVQWGTDEEIAATAPNGGEPGRSWFQAFLLGAIEVPREVPLTGSRELAEFALRTRETTAGIAALQPIRLRVERLLGRLPADDVLAALALGEGQLEPSAILQTRLFTRGMRQASVGETTDGLPEGAAETLWRMWAPLGAWAELSASRTNRARSEARLRSHLGDEELVRLSPACPGARVWLVSSENGSVLLDAEMLGDPVGSPRSAFALLRAEVGVELKVRASGRELHVSRCPDGDWDLHIPEGEDLPADFPSHLGPKVEIRFAYRHGQDRQRWPNPQIVELVQRGQAATLEAIQGMVLPLPASPIGDEAFQEAGFDWAIRAARYREVAEDLSKICQEHRDLAGEALRREDHVRVNVFRWRAIRELKDRWHRDIPDNPLLGVHLISWLVALGLVWRGRGQVVPFFLPEDRLIELAGQLNSLAPRLLEYDLQVVCALEAFHDSIQGTDDGTRSGETGD